MLRTLETVSLPFEAEHMQRVLATAGIESFIEGMNGANAFGLNTALGSIKIQVHDADVARARQVLSEVLNAPGQAWYCGDCQETNEANFDYCWKCGGEKSDVATEPPQSEQLPEQYKPEDMLSPQPVAAPYNPAPYAPPTSALALSAPEFDSAAAQVEYEDTIQRAYRASLIALITVPVLLNIYSLVLLLGALSLPGTTTSTRLAWQFGLAMLINLLVFFMAGIVFWWYLRLA